MGIALIIVGGLVIMTVIAAGSDYLSKRTKTIGKGASTKIAELEARISVLEQQNDDKREILNRLEREMSFMNKLLEYKKE